MSFGLVCDYQPELFNAASDTASLPLLMRRASGCSSIGLEPWRTRRHVAVVPGGRGGRSIPHRKPRASRGHKRSVATIAHACVSLLSPSLDRKRAAVIGSKPRFAPFAGFHTSAPHIAPYRPASVAGTRRNRQPLGRWMFGARPIVREARPCLEVVGFVLGKGHTARARVVRATCGPRAGKAPLTARLRLRAASHTRLR